MTRWITSIASAASIISLASFSGLPVWIKLLITLVGIGCLICLLYSEIRADRVNKLVCHSEDEIKEAMIKIIKTQGRICIVSRDLSWVDDDVKEYIKNKRGNILIFAEKETALTKELKLLGADIKYYKDKFEPKTRFTIIRYNRDNPQVAVANRQDTIRRKGVFTHEIYQTSTANNCEQDKWINSMALDMMKLCLAVCEDCNEEN